MKRIHYIFFLLLMLVIGCEQEHDNERIGFLNFNIDTRVSVVPNSKAIVENYRPKQLRVEILNVDNQVVASTNDYDSWKYKDSSMPLPAGRYTIKAHSYGFDGNASGFDVPFYAGSTEVVVESGVLKTAEIVCTQANVKVTVNFSKSFMEAFTSAKAKIMSAVSGVEPLYFIMGENTASAYFPVGDLSSTISVVNKFNKEFSQTDDFAKNVKPRSHYILNYKVSESGNGGVIVQTDDEQRTYTFTFNVSTEASTQLGIEAPNAWSRFAFLKGSVLNVKQGVQLLPENMIFEYKAKADNVWNTAKAVLEGKTYSGKITALEPGVEYTCRMVYRGAEEYVSNAVNFVTETEFVLPNGSLDDWFKVGKTWYPISDEDYSQNRKFWDSSNPGTTTGVGSFVGINPTEGVGDDVHTAGGKAAQLKSQFASAFGFGKFAAGSLYSGEFGGFVGSNGAKLNLGRPFAARPTQLTGWFKYSTGKIDYLAGNLPEGTVTKDDNDLWTAYIALTTGAYTLDNTRLKETAKDYAKLLQDDTDNFVVAYGALSDAECVSSTEWKKFTIDLTYKDLVRKPTHVIIVISSSKYGDYFTGSTKSVLRIDDLNLVYGEEPKLK